MNDIRICPICKRKFALQIPLVQTKQQLCCEKNHSFDLAAGGYVNLLPPSAGKHGDNKAMVSARRTLLDSGIYAPFRDALAETVSQSLPRGAILWDSGCGEGYYTSALADAKYGYTVYGSDLSTAALIGAHKRCNALCLTAASAYDLPVADGCADGVICLFAPEALEEFSRILAPTGILILGIPGKRHLFGLKEILYSTPYENSPREPSLAGFELLQDREILYTATLEGAAHIESLFAMTPYAYRTSAEGKARLAALQTLTTQLHFHLLLYRKADKP